MRARRSFFVAALLLGACGQAVPPRHTEAPPKAAPPQEAEAPARAVPPPNAEAPPKVEPPPAQVARAPSSPPAAPAPTKPASPSRPPAQIAAAKPAPSPAVAKPSSPPPAPRPAAPEAARPAPQPLDLASLESRLKDTGAIGVLTKLSLKNQVDDLIDRFLAFHDGKQPPTLSELRPAYELLLMKVLSLLQDKDTALARDINASREAIWSLLTDRQKLARYK
jgi:hypothetical protein